MVRGEVEGCGLYQQANTVVKLSLSLRYAQLVTWGGYRNGNTKVTI